MTSQEQSALQEFAVLFNDGMLGDHIGSGLTCNEVEVFAKVIALGGDFDAAVSLLISHGWNDEDREQMDTDDRHHHISAASAALLIVSLGVEQ